MHSSKPAQGKVVDSCQLRGVWRCLVQLGSSTVKRLPCWCCQPSYPWTLSPFSQPARQQTSWKVPFDHGDGAPFPASKLLSRFEGVCPWTGKSSLSEKSIKANSCVSGSARQPCNRHTHTHTHTRTHFDIKESLELLSCVHQHRPNMKTTFLDQPLNFITLSHQLVFSRQQLLFTLLTNFISFISKTQLAADEKLCPANRPTATSTLFFHRVLCLWALLVFKTSKVEWSEEGAGW